MSKALLGIQSQGCVGLRLWGKGLWCGVTICVFGYYGVIFGVGIMFIEGVSARKEVDGVRLIGIPL